MSHHYAGPDFGFPNGDPRLNVTDLYAFATPDRAGRSIIIMNVHPSSTLNPQTPTTRDPFSTDALYEINIDTNGDAIADIAYRIQFSRLEDGSQTATVHRASGSRAAATGELGEVVVKGAPVSVGREARITTSGDHRFFAGWRSDPFFFDPLGALNNLQFTGSDFLADKDVCGIVLDIPNSLLGSGKLGLWTRALQRAGSSWVQVDRVGRPQQGVFLVGDERAAYLAADPANDARFIPVFAHSLEHTGGYSNEEARRVARTLLPDILSFDPSRPAVYPKNGRKLVDDVSESFLTLITNGKVTTDGVGPHTDLIAEFPYMGPPHQ